MSEAEFVLSKFDLGQVSSAQPLGNAGGFSGAKLWKINCERGDFCLRQWPINHAVNVADIHAVLKTATAHSVPVAAPIAALSGETVVHGTDKRTWELANWIPGAADFNDRPSSQRLRSAVTALAKFHQVTSEPNEFCKSSGLAFRLAYLSRASRELAKVELIIAKATSHPLSAPAKQIASQIRSRFEPTRQKLTKFADSRLPHVNAIRDIHHDHLFFQGDSLSGIVDFGSLKREARCFDLARMLGSLLLDGETPWEQGFSIYSETNQLEAEEVELAKSLFECSLVLGSLNWLTWIFSENRQFEDWAAVKKRLQGISGQLSA
jgi:Ser/Thr protein kinase RdoA (MazF antagonist)